MPSPDSSRISGPALAPETPLTRAFRPRRVSWRRLLAGGLAAATLVAAVGFLLEWRRFGADTAGAIARAATGVQARFAEISTLLERVATDIATDPAAIAASQAAPDAAKALFDVVERHSRRVVEDRDVAVTVYDRFGTGASAWAGRPSDFLPSERLLGNG